MTGDTTSAMSIAAKAAMRIEVAFFISSDPPDGVI
jgi:hypothetical protein